MWLLTNEHDAPPSVGHIARLLGEVLGKGEELFERDVFAPGDEVNLVVAASHDAIGD